MKFACILWCLVLVGCGVVSEPEQVQGEAQALSCDPRIGLGVYFMNGSWNPDMSPFPNPERPTTLSIVEGPDRYVQEVYLASFLPTTLADGPDPLMTTGDFAGLDWSGLEEVGEDWRLEANGYTWQHQVFYREAAWMNEKSDFTLTFRDQNNHKLDKVKIQAGKDDDWKEKDDFGERRFVVRVLSTGCAAEGDCSTATHFAEALVQLRVNLHPNDTFEFPTATARLDLTWSAYSGHTWQVPVVVTSPDPSLGYGLNVSLAQVSPPASGYYLPGEPVQIQVTFKDNDGNRLFPVGSMPSYEDVVNRRPQAKGLRYLTFNGLPTLYWAHKPLQGAMQTFFAGPLHKMTSVGTTPITPFSLFMPEIPAATRAVDGWSSLLQETPITPIMFTCLGDPSSAACDAPTSDIYTYTVPADAENGTYVTGIKARREWEGEPAMDAASLRIQVGSPTTTTFPGFPVAELDCADCHQGPMALPNAGHGFPGVNAVGPECLSCHTDGYYFEPDAGMVTRLNYLHEQSRRLDPP